jgi:hypothetical protein
MDNPENKTKNTQFQEVELMYNYTGGIEERIGSSNTIKYTAYVIRYPEN